MIKSLAVVSLLTSAVLAQSVTTTSTTANLIPAGITQPCTDFLTSLDKDTSLTACTSSLVSITSAYLPGGTATTSPSTSQIQSTLNNLCSTSTTTCSEGDMRKWLTQFYAQCRTELTSNPVAAVKQIYDVLYASNPLRTAICSKDDNGSFCVTKLPASNGLKNALSNGGSSAMTPTDVMNALAQEQSTHARRAATTALVPNITTYQNTNLPFLFLQPASGAQSSLQSSSQCTACTRNIMTAYINFESDTPYGPGLGGSLLLAGQQKLYDAITNTCGKTFLSGVVQAAGGLSSGGGPLSSGAMQSVVTVSQGFVAVGMGVLAVLVSSGF